jgi:histidinol-phosphate aminotransferase
MMGYFRKNIEQMRGYVPGFQPSRTDVAKLNTNENPYPPSPKVLEAIAGIRGENLRRYPDPTAKAFREAAARVSGVRVDDIMCCNGGDDLINIAIRAFCDSERPLAYPVPTYSLYPVLAKIQQCEAIEVPFDREFNLPSKLAKTGAGLTIVCNPNAPSGTFAKRPELASLADELSGVLMVDEAYVDFAEGNCAALVKDFDNVIIVRSMSKGYSLAGMRFGYAIAQRRLIDGLMKVRDSYAVDAVAIAAATAAIKDQAYFEANVEQVKVDRGRVTEGLRGLGFSVPESSANFVLARPKDGNAREVYEELVKRDIYVRYFELEGLADKLRITIGTAEQNDRLLAALKEILKG